MKVLDTRLSEILLTIHTGGKKKRKRPRNMAKLGGKWLKIDERHVMQEEGNEKVKMGSNNSIIMPAWSVAINNRL